MTLHNPRDAMRLRLRDDRLLLSKDVSSALGVAVGFNQRIPTRDDARAGAFA